MNNTTAFSIMLSGVLIACCSQYLLKKAAMKEYTAWYLAYLNVRVLFAYFLMVVSTVCSVFAYKVLPLTIAPVFAAVEQITIALMSVFILKERATRRKWLGLSLILLGIMIYALPF